MLIGEVEARQYDDIMHALIRKCSWWRFCHAIVEERRVLLQLLMPIRTGRGIQPAMDGV
jgi:hypothetical protein